MFDFILKAVAMYLSALVIIRIMGKRALGELGLFDFVVMTGVGHVLTSVALEQSLPFYEGVGVLIILGLMEWFTGVISLKSEKLSHIISGRPVVMINNGMILKENLAREKFNIDDLLQELRKQGIRDVCEVEKGILEPSGGFSVILRSDAEPVTRGELGINWTPDFNSILTYESTQRANVFNPTGYPPRNLDSTINLSEDIYRLDCKVDEILERLKALERST